MAKSLNAEVFPLPLSAWERYMLADDRPDYPMTFAGRIMLSGDVNVHKFEDAFDEALSRHPLLRAVVARGRRGGWIWTAADGLRPAIDWAPGDVPLVCPGGEAIDLRRETGLRIWVRQGSGRSEVTYQFHHACTDGIGALEFVGDLLAAYGIRTASGPERPVLRPLDTTRLRLRNQFTIPAPASVSRWQALCGTLREAAKWLGRRPMPLDPPEDAGPGRPQFPGICFHAFDEAQTRCLRSLAARRGVTLNDLLLAQVFQVLQDWNQQSQPGRDGWLRINMPASLREARHEGMPAANVMTHAFLTRRTHDCDDPGRLLDGIRQETEAIKRWRLGLHFLGGLALLGKVPGGLPLVLALGRLGCHATAVVTCLGDPVRRFTARFPRRDGRVVAGNLTLEGMAGVPPLRPGTKAVLSVGVYAGKLTASIRCDPHSFTAEATGRLLDLLAARLNELAAAIGDENASAV